MSGIQFTQYLMRDGRKQQIFIDRPEDVEEIASKLVDRGVALEIEMLSDYNTISMTAELPDEDDPVVAHELVPNGPLVPEAVDRMIRAAAERLGVAT